MKRLHQSIFQAATRIAKSAKAAALFVSVDSPENLPEGDPPKGCSLILVTRHRPDEWETLLPEGTSLPHHLLHLPKIDMTRMGQVKMAVVLALSQQRIKTGDRIVFVTGVPERGGFDTIILLDTGRESELLTTQGMNGISEEVKPEVFQATLATALELAARGREGKPVGTTFVLGDEEKVMQLSKQMIINPFKGYADDERNILNPSLKETLREFAAIDGAFVISRDGLVLTAGRYLGAAGDETTLPRGLGSRHIAAAGITALTQAMAVVISESSGDVRIFKNGKILMEIEKPTRPPGNP